MYALPLILLFINTSTPRTINAPHFALYNLNGQLVTLRKEIKSNNIILAFFASYCVPCKREIPELQAIATTHNQSCKLLLINIDREGAQKAEQFLSNNNIHNVECLLDIYQTVISKYVPEKKVPAFFLINKNRQILIKSIGDNPGNINRLKNILSNIR